jgi:hypothetical protein
MSSALVWLTADAVVLECLGNGADGIWYVVVCGCSTRAFGAGELEKGFWHAEVCQVILQSYVPNVFRCSVCEEGAGVGHSCSLTTLVNLMRMGNPHIEVVIFAYLFDRATHHLRIRSPTQPDHMPCY